MTTQTTNSINSKVFKHSSSSISNMIPGDPTGSPDESFFNASSPQYDERNAGLPIFLINYLNLTGSIYKWRIQ